MQIGRVAHQALMLIAEGRAVESATLISRTRGWDEDACLLVAMSRAKAALGDADHALYFARRAFEREDGDADTAAEFLRAAWIQPSGAKAENAVRAVLRGSVARTLSPDFFSRAVAGAMHENRWAAAAGIARTAREKFPEDLELAHCYGTMLLKMGNPEGALAHLRRVIASPQTQASPKIHALHLLHAVVTNYVCEDPAVVAAAHGALNASLAASNPLIAAGPLPPNDPDPSRKIHVGVLAADFYDHAVMRFLISFLLNRSCEKLRVSCFSTGSWEDSVTERVRGLVDAFHVTGPPRQPEEDCRLLRQARVDVMIDLAGLMWGERAEALFHRVAPVQLSMIGYPASLGLANMDVRVVDSLTDPAGSELFSTERLARIDPCFLCYTPREDAPPVQELAGDRGIVFGSFNTLQKHSLRTLTLWARVLDRVPGSRLLIKNLGMGDHGTRQGLLERLGSVGIDPARCDLLDFVRDRSGHLAAYGRVDIALDTFPYHGTTTTCEAMWMGVPVVTRFGRTHASRVGLSLLNAVGLRDLACGSDEEFIDVATALACDPARRTELRSTLRARMTASPLCDAVAHTRRLETVIRTEWERVCAGAGGA